MKNKERTVDLLWGYTTRGNYLLFWIARPMITTKIFRQWLGTAKTQCTLCGIVESYSSRWVSTSQWYTAPQSQMRLTTSDKSARKHVSYVWCMSEWRSALVETTKPEWFLTHYRKSMIICSMHWCFRRSATTNSCAVYNCELQDATYGSQHWFGTSTPIDRAPLLQKHQRAPFDDVLRLPLIK